MMHDSYFFQEVPPMVLIFRSRKSISRCAYSLGIFAALLIAGLSICTRLAAQQTEVDAPRPAVLVASTAASPAPDPAPQATSATPQSSTTSQPAGQTPPAQTAPGDATGQQTKRILGIIPNFRAVSADQELPPETVKDKFMSATEASENYMVEFIFPTLTREDSRYYTLGRGGFFKRTGYALSRAVATRSNSGAEVFNISEVFGAGAASGISNLYYPSASRSVGNTMSEWAEDVGIDAASFWVKEFWPDINRHVFHNKYGQQ
jgi:hypothetical protein